MKILFTEEEVTAEHAELAALREYVHKLMLVGEIVVSHRSEQLHSLRMPERLAAWRRTNGFDRREIWVERQSRAGGRVYLMGDPESAISM